jgi:glycosyltransferase involved in cell wall biosynthesis
MSAAPVVSILIPAYNERYFADAFASARAQQGVDLEILVCDDSPGEAIGRVVAEAKDERVRYVRNPANLGFGANFSKCFELARGELLKFLNDDDRLRPGCVAALAAGLKANPAVKLATSRRLSIDAAGERLPDGPATVPLALLSSLMSGRELGDFVLLHSVNFIGEPTTAMFRKADVMLEDHLLFRWGGRDFHCLADLGLWLRLLSQGLAYYVAAPLSEFRIHEGQEQLREGVRIGCLMERLWLYQEARKAGFLASVEAQRAALQNLKSRISPMPARPGFTDAERESLRTLLAGIDGELASLR